MSFHNPSISFSKFSAADFAQIADMPVEIVRVWRNRGHIGGGGGRGATYPSSELAEAMIRYDLARHGLPPSESIDIGYMCAGKILRYVMLNHANACEVRGPKDAVDRLRELWKNSDALSRLYFGARADDELLVRKNGGELEFRSSEWGELQAPTYRSALVFNLEAYAARLVEMAEKPIIIFSFNCKDGEERVRSSLGDIE